MIVCTEYFERAFSAFILTFNVTSYGLFSQSSLQFSRRSWWTSAFSKLLFKSFVFGRYPDHCCVASYRTGFKMDAVVLPQPNGDILSSPENGISGETVKKRLSVERIYQKKTQLEHILLRPDSYIGSTLKDTQQMWVLDESQQHMVNRDITFSPGLYKIFDEILGMRMLLF